jgi:hypothetical protein
MTGLVRVVDATIPTSLTMNLNDFIALRKTDGYVIPPDGVLLDGNNYVTGHGQVLYQIHPPDRCVGPCPIHGPSNHVMRSFPTFWRTAGVFDIKPSHMERICPHGVGHPDPDGSTVELMVHGCDGCCEGRVNGT